LYRGAGSAKCTAQAASAGYPGSQDRSKGRGPLPSNSPGTQGSKGLSEGPVQERCGSNRTGSAPVFPSPFVFSFESSSNELSGYLACPVLLHRPGQNALSDLCKECSVRRQAKQGIYANAGAEGHQNKSYSPPKASPKKRSSGTELPKFQITVQRDCDGARSSARSPTNNVSLQK
jgi:hypothetical protein